MDDSCAVCAEPLEWVAYGPCGHRDVCSTCVARLRFICSDRRCCICKSESSVVFVTKALGDYTRMINDFSVLPSEVKEGKLGSYWYHDDTQAFFDDADHYRMIKAMCRLSCSECDKTMEQQPNDGPKHRAKFKNIGQLKGHLFHQHKLSMCSLCLEGRKIFICEQKLYTKTQLKQHTLTGDAEADGSESERGGFMGHPSCEFCKTPFYGDNELYTHMNAAHYTCHICQRQHPGQYEYYKNYDGLEMHFRRDHFLCEDETCLAQKFVVFQSEAEIKRHNTKEHGGRMSRSKRNAALQIPTSFRYRSNNAQAPRRGRGRGQMFRPEPSDYQLSMAIEASLESSNAENPPSPPRTQTPSDFRDAEEIDPIVQPFEALTTDSESAARYLQAVGQSYRSGSLQESAFPPLPGAASSSQQTSKHETESLGHNSRNGPLHGSSFPPLSTASSSTQLKPKQESEGTTTMATKLSHKNNKNRTSPNSAQGWSATGRGSALPASNPNQPRPTAKVAPVAAASPSSSIGTTASSYASYAQLHAQRRPETISGLQSIGSLRGSGLSSRIGHSASSPNLAGNRSTEPSASDFPPVSAAQLHKTLPRAEDVQTANKSLVESIRSALEFDEEKYTTFKDVSGKYRQGLIDTESYLDYVINFGLSHLVIDLARLCPDPEKQKELVDTYNSSLKMAALQEDSRGPGVFHLKNGNSNSRGKGKLIIAEKQVVNPKDLLADNIMSTVRKLQSNYKPSLEEEEVLSKDGYRAAKGKSGVVVNELQKMESSSSATSSGSESSGRKKTTKFHRISLGGGPLHLEPNPADGKSTGGVWGKGGGQKLFSGGSMGRS